MKECDCSDCKDLRRTSGGRHSMSSQIPEHAYEATRKFILRERIGWLRTMSQYMPPVLRKRYLETLDEIAEILGGTA